MGERTAKKAADETANNTIAERKQSQERSSGDGSIAD